MSPYAEADERDRPRCRNHHGVAEDYLAREYRDNFGGEREGRNDQYVNLGMPENPEEVLPEYCGAAGLGIEEVRAEEAIEQEHHLRRGKRSQRDQHHER